MRLPVTVLVCLVLGVVGAGTLAADPAHHHVRPSCGPDVRTCRFVFTVRYNVTMMKWQGRDPLNPDNMVPIVSLYDGGGGGGGGLYAKRKDCSGKDLLDDHDLDTMMSGDGSYKRVIVVNGQLPGTPIVVYKGQHVSVTVINKLENEVLTIHWHGLHMRRTPWMDGAGAVSQCPIQPRQAFEYRFVADPVGTHWWHGHFSSERTMGLFGPLIVLHRSPEDEQMHRGDDPLPLFKDDFTMMVTDWFPEPTDEMFTRLEKGGIGFANSLHGEPSLPTSMADGTVSATFTFYSALINGKGWHFNSTTGEPDNTALPLEVFTVQKDQRYRFRLINVAMDYNLQISIDNHILHVFTSDGQPTDTVKVQSLVISSGERYDFWVEAKDPLDVGNYWIRVETLEYYSAFGERMQPGHVEAILRYEGADVKAPTTLRPRCLRKPCEVLNCPFRAPPSASGERCVSVESLRRPTPRATLQPADGTGFSEYFLNFQMGPGKSSINGKIHVPHAAPPQLYPKIQKAVPCDTEECKEAVCKCTHQLQVTLGHVVQMVFVSVRPEVGPPAVTFHPIHTHGHKFQVVKVGWPVYDVTTGKMVANSPDIDYSVSPVTGADLRWANGSWAGGRVPGLVQHDPVEKDTVLVPAGGYVVVRFLADNPGYWLVHCHMESHSSAGMMLLMQEGEVADMNAPPSGMPTCGDFDWSSEEYLDKITNPKPPTLRMKAVERKASATKTFQIATIVGGCAVSALILLAVVVFRRTTSPCTSRKPSSGNTRVRRTSYGGTGSGTVTESMPSGLLHEESTPLIGGDSVMFDNQP